MASKTTSPLNEASKHQTKQSLAGINSQYTETPSPSRKLKSAPPNVNANTFDKKIPSLLKRSHPIFLRHGFSYFNVERNQAGRDQVGESNIKNKHVRKTTSRTKAGKFIPKN